MPGYLLAVTRLGLLTVWCALMVPPQIILLWFHKGPRAYTIPRLWHRGVCRICGLKVEIEGDPVTDRQVLYVSNHLSYLDIPVIGSFLKASFIAKEDIAHWPVIGFLSTVQQTAFISRSSSRAKHVKNALGDMLAEGKSLILFPEGTSSPGKEVLPFKSSLFALTMEKDASPLPIQPFTLSITAIEKAPPMNDTARNLYAWHGDMDFAPHSWTFLKTKGATIRLTFHPPIIPAPHEDRKTVARLTWERVASTLPSSLDSPPQSGV
jgi:1-acyl-sn-glycerol-3-phosphate acyltransferase